MADAVIMPKAGMAMESGVILKWLKSEGDEVRAGEPLLEIETDKVSMEVEAETSGVLLKILRREGEEIPVTETIAYIGETGEDVPDGVDSPAAAIGKSQATSSPPRRPTAAGRIAATPLARTLAAQRGIELSSIAATGADGEVKARDVLADSSGTPMKASPLARRIAQMEGIDLNRVSGSGPAGKILKQDVVSGAVSATSSASVLRRPVSPARRRIAHKMSESHRSIPPVTLNGEADVTDLLALKEQIGLQTDNHYSFNDFILAATTRALEAHPDLMQQLDEDELILPDVVNLGVAVSVGDVLLVPVVHDAASLSFAGLAARARTLIEAARSNKLRPDDLAAGTFTVTNLGMFGITDFTPIINSPECAILGVGSIRDVLRLDGEKVISRNIVTLSLTIDHRIIDGVAGARFLSTVREMLERPLKLLA